MAMEGRLDDFYDRVASKYDDNKGNSCMYPFLIRGMINKPAQDIHVLDVGCGPGTVAAMLLQSGIGYVSLMEPSVAMMSVAETKLKQEIQNGRVNTKLDGLPTMEYDDASFDAVMMNLVIHFVDSHEVILDAQERKPSSEAARTYPKMLQSFQETYRVLKPGGILIMTTGLPHQLRYSRWYAEFFPWRVAHCYPRQACREEFEVLLKQAGFVDVLNIIDTSCPLIDDSVLHDPYGIEREDWRAGDSDFLSLTDEELKNVLEKVKVARENGELETIMKRAKENRDRMGQMTIIIARK